MPAAAEGIEPSQCLFGHNVGEHGTVIVTAYGVVVVWAGKVKVRG